jgi:hypothetical protein
MLENELWQFLESSYRNRWLEHDKIKVYVRKAHHFIKDQACECLDIASIEVIEEFQHQGVFKDFLDTALTLNPYPCLYIENVLNQNLVQYLKRRGFYQIGDVSPCFYWSREA